MGRTAAMMVGGLLACLVLFLVVIWVYNATGAIIATVAAFAIIALIVGYFDRKSQKSWDDA
ncbi:MAG TPA: hypothetical protein VLK36_13275 [Gaiellaceae bacterium]|nr:hypothetical protein [Gaiellaceae bacterium]